MAKDLKGEKFSRRYLTPHIEWREVSGKSGSRYDGCNLFEEVTRGKQFP
jgi:hypothetical protein